MSSREEWKLAQDKVLKAMKDFESTRKDFIGKAFTDTYAARGNMVQSQPSDLWFLYQGVFATLEVKSSHYQDKFYFKDVQTSQFAGARRIPAAGGVSLFVLAKLPSWHWFIADGRDMYARRERGDNGILWAEMVPLAKLTMEAVLCEMRKFYSGS